MNKFRYCIIWEEEGSETVVYGPYETRDAAKRGLLSLKASIALVEDDDPNDFGHDFQLANYIEVKNNES